MEFNIILAMDVNRGIGLNGQLPWHKPVDMEFFKNITCNKKEINAIIMGRRTADSLPFTLPHRINVVITSSAEYRERFICFTNLDSALESLSRAGVNKIFVIGGAQLAETAIIHRKCQNIYITYINETHKCDTHISEFFMKTLNKNFNKVSEKNIGELTFCKYTYYNTQENQYIDLLSKLMQADKRLTRNAETYSIFGERLEFDLQMGFPLLTTKKMFSRGILEELLFFLRGDTDTKILENLGVNIWRENTSVGGKNLKPGEMGPMYGYQWRNFNSEGKDQLAQCIDLLISDPTSRRIIMTAYNPLQAEEGVLYPCHGITIQFYVEMGRISLQMYQRSADAFLGLPFNIASYAAMLTVVVALVNGIGNKNYIAGRLIIVLGDVHLYTTHRVAAALQISRRQLSKPFPTIYLKKSLNTLEDINTLESSDFVIENYEFCPAIKASMIL